MFTLINAIVGAIINVIQLILGLELPYPVSAFTWLATIIPVIALCVSVALHDTDRSGAWALALSGTGHWLVSSVWYLPV